MCRSSLVRDETYPTNRFFRSLSAFPFVFDAARMQPELPLSETIKANAVQSFVCATNANPHNERGVAPWMPSTV